MKKFSKIMVFILMLAVSIASFAISPALGIVMASGTGLVGASIALTKMPTKGEVNKPVYLPKGTSNNSADVTIKVTDPRGKAVELGSENLVLEADGEHAGQYKLIPTMVGNYKVQYTASAVTGYKATTSQQYIIKVTSSKATLSFDENTPFMLPTTIGENTSVVLPYPNISETGKEEDEVKGNYDTVKVVVKDANHDVVAEKTVTIDGKKYYVLTANKDAEENTIYGTYSVAYSYVNASGIRVTKSYSVNVSPNYTVDNQNITFTWEGSLPESATLGNEVKLPKPVTVDKNSNNASVLTYTKVEVNYLENGEVKNTYDVDEQDFTFKPMDEAKNNNYYQIKYKIYTLEKLDLYKYFNENTTATFADYIKDLQPTLERTYDLKNVTDNVNPTPVAVNAYEVSTSAAGVKSVADDIDTTDISYMIPSKARIGVEIELPAIYATDNFDEYGSLTLTRGIIYKATSTSTSDTTTYVETASNTDIKDGDGNDLLTFVKAEANEMSKVTFHQAGTYKIIYQARDASGNVNRDVVYKIVVPTDANYADTVAPYITLTGLPNSVVNGETLSFAMPTVVDYEKDHDANPTSTSTVDSNVKTDVYYYFGDYVAGKEPSNADCFKIEKNADDSTLYSFDVNATDQSKLTIVVRAEDDAKYTKNGLGVDGADINNVSYAHKTINIYGLNDDDKAPELYDANSLETLATKLNDNGESENYGQGEEIIIFDDSTEVKFSDKNTSGVNKTGNLVSNLVVYDANGNEIEVTGFTYEYDGSYITLKGGKIVTSVAGEYSVVITTTDVAGNSLINSVNFVVRDTKAPSIQVKGLKTTMELGTTYTLPTPIVVDDGKVIENKASMTVKFIEAPGNTGFQHESLSFTPSKAGTYSFVYVASDGVNKIESDVYTITVKDTVDPVIVLDENDAQVPLTAKVGVEVELPSFTAEDANGIKSLTLKVTNPDGDVVDPVEGKEFTFKFEKDGKYNVVYTAVDLAGNTAELEYTISVGDVVAPKFVIGDANKIINKTFKVGEKFSLVLDDVTVTDGDKEYDVEDELDKTDGKVSITVISPDGKTTKLQSTNNYSYTFESAGTYTLKYSATDEAGNTTEPISYTFEVKGNANSSSITEQTWGVVLIVVSIALLAGVVIYFVKTKDKTDAKEKAKELAKKNKKDDE
ncbi:MAG: hypothetical protein ACI4TZ_02150 [Christensenellales bacterium]